MKRILYIAGLLIITLSLSSCRWEEREDPYQNQTGFLLRDFLQSYDLWYVDIDHTTGSGDVGFVSRAFTMSFRTNGEVFANNNIVGLGQTGNGYGISIGTYNVNNSAGILSIKDDIDGWADFEVRQLSNNEITLFNRANNVTYSFVGYQKYNFDFDRLFYENITYFLQEYQAWSKTNEIIHDASSLFIAENHMTFYVSGNTNVFETSESIPNIPFGNILWDYTGTYEVYNTSHEDIKDLVLQYDINGQSESFKLSIIDDETIELTNIDTHNVFRFAGQEYIQYRPAAKRLPQKHIEIENMHYKLMQ